MTLRFLFFISLLGSLFFISCNSAVTSESASTYPESFQETLDAHGGLRRWQQMKGLAFTLQRDEKIERHQVGLPDRHSRIEQEGKYVLGYDGKEVWVSPHRDSFPGGSPRFYHNLHFYFFAMPFVLADPGITLVDDGLQQSGGKEYRVIRATFEAGVGDAPDDHYNLYTDPQTHLVDFITYSVTYFDKSKANQYNALKFEWKRVDDLQVPSSYTGYKWENGALGEKRFTYTLSDIGYQTIAFSDAIFTAPAGSFIDQSQE